MKDSIGPRYLCPWGRPDRQLHKLTTQVLHAYSGKTFHGAVSELHDVQEQDSIFGKFKNLLFFEFKHFIRIRFVGRVGLK